MRIGINLPDDKLKILNALLDMLEAGFPEDIAIVACYGSYVTGVPTNVSDIDFYFIPSTPRGYQMSYQFIVDRIGYDLWPVSWERAERMANFDELLVSLIADARAVYYRNSEDMDRFNSLKHKVRELMQPPNRPILLRRAEAMLGRAKRLFFDAYASDGDLQKVLVCSASILEYVLAALAFVNSSYVKKGAVRVEDEITRFQVVPQGFLGHFRAVINGKDPRAVLGDLKALIKSVDAAMMDYSNDQERAVSSESASGFYEELRSTYNRLRHACDRTDQAKAFFAVNAIVSEVRHLLGAGYDSHGFPDLHTPLSQRNYELLNGRATVHEAMLVSVLKDHKVPINEFAGADEFCSSLRCTSRVQEDGPDSTAR